LKRKHGFDNQAHEDGTNMHKKFSFLFEDAPGKHTLDLYFRSPVVAEVSNQRLARKRKASNSSQPNDQICRFYDGWSSPPKNLRFQLPFSCKHKGEINFTGPVPSNKDR